MSDDDLRTLDARIDALRQAVANHDGTAIAEQLQAIDTDMAQRNPLIRGTTYAHVQAVLGKPEEAASAIESLLEVTNDPMLHYQLGCYRRDAGLVDEAVAAFETATSLRPDLVDAWLSAGILRDGQGDAVAAVAFYRQAVVRAPADADVWRNLGNSLAALRHFEQSAQAYTTALSLRPQDDTIAILLASTHQARGDIEAANAILEPLGSEIGLVVEVSRQRATDVVRCRFHCRATDTAAAARAKTLLHALDDEPLTDGERRTDAGWLVRTSDTVLLCDPDQACPDRPHRFMDASRLVLGA